MLYEQTPAWPAGPALLEPAAAVASGCWAALTVCRFLSPLMMTVTVRSCEVLNLEIWYKFMLRPYLFASVSFAVGNS